MSIIYRKLPGGLSQILYQAQLLRTIGIHLLEHGDQKIKMETLKRNPVFVLQVRSF